MLRDLKLKIKIKIENNKLMSSHTDDEKPLEKYKTMSTKIEDIKNVELNALLAN